MSDMSEMELLEVLKEYSNCDGKETVECVTDLLKSIREDSDKFCNKLETCLEEFAEDNDICPICGEYLAFKPETLLPKYQGSHVGVNVCPNGCDC